MSSFMRLPLELREQIIELALEARHSPPSTIPSKSTRVFFRDVRGAESEMQTIYHEKNTQHSPSNCLSLLLANHQLSDETLSVLSRMETDYALDIAVHDDLRLFPTWLSIPRITNRVSTLHVDIRLFGHIMSWYRVRGQAGRSDFHWSFYSLLERFLHYGPVGQKKGKPAGTYPGYQDREMSVKTIVLDFQSAEPNLSFPPVECGYHRWWNQHNGIRSRDNPRNLKIYKTRPEWPARYLSNYIRVILGFGMLDRGKPLYERVGKIQILIQGELDHEIDLARRLVEMDPSVLNRNGRPSDEDEFQEWRQKALEKRKERGLPTASV
ncbi:hypothetical protein FQN50_001454 [Emmonsiellopsis sp. PD_5]|nr:hypothetical protein FQN50_001454 [Emmonsiellopsis sp. PD_5]